MIDQSKRSRLVGEFIKKRRELMGISQRTLGLSFTPPVTTQFISNVERGVTPLPLSHVPVLSRVLSIPDTEIAELLEREYVIKVNGRLGRTGIDQKSSSLNPSFAVSPADLSFMKNLYEAFRLADPKTRQTFTALCESVLKVAKPSEPAPSAIGE